MKPPAPVTQTRFPGTDGMVALVDDAVCVCIYVCRGCERMAEKITH